MRRRTMSITLGVIMDPIASITPYKDSTLAMMLEAQRRGWEIYYMTPDQLYLDQGKVRTHAQKVIVNDDNQNCYELADKEDISVTKFHIMLMRQNPTVYNNYLYCNY